MEDSVSEVGSLVFPMNNTRSGRGRDEEEKDQGQDRDEEPKGGGGGEGEEEGRSSGIISHIISNLVSGGREDEKEKSVVEKGGKEEEKEVGLISNLISNLVSPLSSKLREGNEGRVENFEVKDEGKTNDGNFKSEEGLGGGGGIVNEEGNIEVVERKEQVKTEVEGGGGGGGRGIIDNIVSHFPTVPLADDAALATDEASLLIHSIVHD